MPADSCPNCNQPYSASIDGESAMTIHHSEASNSEKQATQARTCILARDSGLAVFYHRASDLEADQDDRDVELGENEAVVYRQLETLLGKIDGNRVKRAELAGVCLQAGLSPDDVDENLEALKQKELVKEPDGGLFTTTELWNEQNA